MSEPNKIMISCREATSLEQMRREGKITFRSRMALWIHLLYCKFCRLFIKQSALLEKRTKEMAIGKSYTISAERKETMKKVLGQ